MAMLYMIGNIVEPRNPRAPMQMKLTISFSTNASTRRTNIEATMFSWKYMRSATFVSMNTPKNAPIVRRTK